MAYAKSAPRKGDLISAAEAAARLGISTSTLQNWIKKGVVKPYYVGPKPLVRFDADDVNKLKRRWARAAERSAVRDPRSRPRQRPNLPAPGSRLTAPRSSLRHITDRLG